MLVFSVLSAPFIIVFRGFVKITPHYLFTEYETGKDYMKDTITFIGTYIVLRLYYGVLLEIVKNYL